MHDTKMLARLFRLAPPLHGLGVHRPVRVRMQIVLILKVQNQHDLVGCGAGVGIEPG